MKSASKMYAAALLSIGREDNTAEKLFNDILETDRLITDNPDLHELLISPAFSAEEKKGVISRLFSGRIEPMLYNTICLLTEKRRMSLFHEIAGEFKNDYYNAYGIAEADVTTAAPMKPEAAERLRIKLEKLYGRKIVLREHLDPNVLGGVRVVCEGKMLDGTLRTRLEGMRDMIKDNISI